MTMKDFGVKIAVSMAVALVSGAASILAGDAATKGINALMNRNKQPDALPEPEVDVPVDEIAIEAPPTETEAPTEVMSADSMATEDGA